MAGPRDWTGWTLEITEGTSVHVELGAPLGELTPAQQDALLAAIGEGQYNACNADETSVVLGQLPADFAAAIASRLALAGFAVEQAPSVQYFASCVDARGRAYIDDVSDAEMARIAEEMIAAGVRVIRRTVGVDDPRLPPWIENAWRRFHASKHD
jgi:hypothetical protein